MKKVVFSLVLFASVIAVSAQPRAIGGRLHYGLEVSYQHGFGERNMLQIDVGVPAFYGIHAVGTYNWVFPISSWQKEGSWNWYAGVGGGLGIYGFGYPFFFVGIAGQIGVEYNFKFPLQLSLDYRPVIGPMFGNGGTWFNLYGCSYGGFGLGIRYKF
jgi:hypothetical protein